ncbi:hypothetical protein [Veillonella agrestimuris]|uniref:hypothetical protein n=1 Tax=Veillonella agrestimuris TaxID=2941340 RepID=UPI00203BC945|nr:hypothetical protein [Veillonella agrestimuris]
MESVTSTQSASSVTAKQIATQSTKTIVCSPQVLAAVTDESLVRLCQGGTLNV